MKFGVAYFGVRDLRHARRDLDEIAEAGFTSVTHTFSEHDLRWHAEDIARLVEETHARELEAELDPWGVAGLFGGEAFSELALVELSSRQVDARGRSVPACCPNAELTRELLRRWAREAAQTGADVLFWDEPHFYVGSLSRGDSPPCCRCEACEKAWRKRGGEAPLPPEGDARLEVFRAESLRDLLAEAIGSVGGTPLRHALCLLPRGEFPWAGSDAWECFAALPGLSRLATDPYWTNRRVEAAEYVRAHARALRTLCDRAGCEMEVWIQALLIRAGEEHHIRRAAEAAIEEGAEKIAFWSFRATERMSSLACANPEAAWSAVRALVQDLA